MPAGNLKELIVLANQSPGKLTFASFGNGSTPHLQGEMLKMTAGIDMVHVTLVIQSADGKARLQPLGALPNGVIRRSGVTPN